jgi:hypothetical protein
MNIATGQEQEFWINPQQRYGKNPKEMMFRFVRQAPIEIDAHNPNIVYHGSQYVHRTVDGGVHWTKFSPDVTANGPEGQVESGEPITRDMTGEEVYAALYSMRSSRLEPGVFWTGSNDGPVWVTRDNGKTWKNVTPRELPPGGRVHTIEDSPHRRGSAYVSVYRMYLNDFKPYLYMTNDYGAHWTLLTDGANGIPANQPMHVVREDPEQEGLLYAGTLEGAYVSFDQGKHWQTLQLNLPATPVTDIKVHHGDLVVSTMGRSFWIMDDVAPLRQLAASVTKPTRSRTTDSPNGQGSPRVGAGLLRSDVALASQDHSVSGLESRPKAAVVQPMKPAPIKPFDGSNVFLFTPAPAYRMRYSGSRGVDMPEYPPAGARIDYYLASPSGDVKLEIFDATGKTVRSYSSAAPVAGPAGRGGGRRGGGLPSALPMKSGMNRFVWDLRYAGGPAGGGDGEGGGFAGGGPMVPPGNYKARLTAGGVTKTEAIVVKRHRCRPRGADHAGAQGARSARRGAAARAAGPAGDRREAWRPGEAAERVAAVDDQDRPLRGSDVHRSDVEHRPRDRPGGPEGGRQRPRAVQSDDEGVGRHQGRCGQGSALNEFPSGVTAAAASSTSATSSRRATPARPTTDRARPCRGASPRRE